jgi:RNA polymerase sigma-70 factor (ECF subfamily)
MSWHGVDLNWAYTVLLRGIQRRTACIHRSYEILHDSLVRLALVNREEPIPQPHAYLSIVVRNVLADRYREESRWVELSDNEDTPEHLLAGGASEYAPSAEHLADLKQRLEITQKILDCLPPRCREVFWHFCVEGYTQPEIAAKLNISLKVVERHVMRAMIDIRAARKELFA